MVSDSGALRFLGIAKKAGKLKCGGDQVLAAAEAGKARLIIAASDAAENTVRRAHGYMPPGTVLISAPFTKREIGEAAGCGETALAVITDHGMAAAFAEKLDKEFPDRYGRELDILSFKADKVLRRRKETAAQKSRRPGGKSAGKGAAAKEENR